MASTASAIPSFQNPDRDIRRDLGDLAGELRAAGQGSFVADLAHLGLLSFTGEDAGSFLQGQLSCDVDALLRKPASTFGAYCSPKGRMLASFLLWHQGDVWYMAVSRSLLASLQKRLSMYVLRAKVKITVASELALLGVGGNAGREALDEIAGVPALQAHALHIGDGLTAMGIPGNRALVVVPAAQASGLWNALSARVQAAGTAAWEWSDIHNGIPWIGAGTQDQLVPQMANLELIGGVSFKKGCYPGQEIVARTQHLGKVKRRMYLAHVPEPAEAGAELHSDDVSGQSNGLVVNAAPAPEGGSDMLVVVQIESAERSRVHLAAADGPVLQFMPLPYALG